MRTNRLSVYGYAETGYNASVMKPQRGLEGGTITCSAPGRAGIIGNPTDMYGGCVVSCSLNERAYCSVSQSDELVIRLGDDALTLRTSEDLELDGGRFDLAKAALQALEFDPGLERFEISIHTDVPEQAGLAGSTAMLASVVGALLEYRGIELNRYQLAEMVKRIESEIMKLTCGYQDHYMAVFGGLSFIDLRGKEWMRQTPDEPFATVESLGDAANGLPIVLAHTGVMRNSGAVHKSIRERWIEGEPAVVNGYSRIAELGRLGKKALLLQDWRELGKLMNENHAIQRDLGGSGPSNERLIEAALAGGAYGAKLAGAGQGGTILALAEDTGGMARTLMHAGAERVFGLGPSEGLVVERTL